MYHTNKMSSVARASTIAGAVAFPATLLWQLTKSAQPDLINAANAIRGQLAVGSLTYIIGSFYREQAHRLRYLNRLISWPLIGYSIFEYASKKGFEGQIYEFTIVPLAAVVLLYIAEFDLLKGTVSEENHAAAKWIVYGLGLAALVYFIFRLIAVERYLVSQSVEVGNSFLILYFGLIASALGCLISNDEARATVASILDIGTQVGFAVSFSGLVYQH